MLTVFELLAGPLISSAAWLVPWPKRVIVPVLLTALAVTVVLALEASLPIWTVPLLVRVPPTPRLAPPSPPKMSRNKLFELLSPVVVVTAAPLLRYNVPALED